MPLALGTSALVLIALLWVIALPSLRESVPRALRALRALLLQVRRLPEPALADGYDPGRELRAEQRARTLLRSCVNEGEWAMYSELGFLRVLGGVGAHPYAYLIYPHKPILAFDAHSELILGEYCVEFPDRTCPYGSSRLPDADDVLAKWIALTADERSLIAQANMHLPGRQISVSQAHRDLARLSCWERERTGVSAPRQSIGRVAPRERASLRAGSVAAL
jgi:hypothetical protein